MCKQKYVSTLLAKRSQVPKEEPLRKHKEVELPHEEEGQSSQMAAILFELGIGDFMQENLMVFQLLKSYAAVKCKTFTTHPMEKP